MKISILLAPLIIVSSFLAPELSYAKRESKPVKVIAPDLIVESFEFGKFPDKFCPMNNIPHENIKFIPCKIVKGIGYNWGYRLKLKTSRTKIKLCSDGDYLSQRGPEAAKPHLPFKDVNAIEVPQDGFFYDDRYVLTFGFRKGQYWTKVWIEGVELPPLIYTIKN